jgi:hypothetical protein
MIYRRARPILLRDLRRRVDLDRLEAPMVRINRSLFDPADEDLFLLRGEWFFRLGRWHHFRTILRDDAFDHLTRVRITWHDGCPSIAPLPCAIALIQSQSALTFVRILPVTSETAVRENGAHISSIVQSFTRHAMMYEEKNQEPAEMLHKRLPECSSILLSIMRDLSNAPMIQIAIELTKPHNKDLSPVEWA